MTPQQTLQLIKTLSALESWAFSLKSNIPDYLHEQLSDCMDALSDDLLGNHDEAAHGIGAK